MSINTLIDKQIKKEIDQFDEDLKSKPDSILQGIGFSFFALKSVLGFLNDADIEEGIVDSAYRNESHDYGIDAIYLTANNSIINTPEELEEYDNNTKFTFHIFQFKKGIGLDINTFLKLKSGLDNAFIENNVLIDQNQYMNNRITNLVEIRDILYEKFPVGRIKINIYVCFSGVKSKVTSDTLLSSHIKSIKDLLEDNSYSNSEIIILGGQELINKNRETESITDILKFKKSMKYIAETEDNIKLTGYIGIVNAEEIAKLVKNYQNLLFEANVRDHYKKNPINNAIFNTCTDNNEGKYFWSLNNGLTLTCSKVDDLPDEKYRIHGLQVVNGCQTSNMIYQAFINSNRRQELDDKKETGTILTEKEKLELINLEKKCLDKDVTILIKIIETSDTDLIYRITETTNSQTDIKIFSLKANEDIHKNIEQFFLENRVYYERRINYYKNKGKTQLIDIKKLSQLYWAMVMYKPSIARSNPKAVFLDNYSRIFPSPENEERNYNLYLIPVLVQLKLERVIRSTLRNKLEADDYKQLLMTNGKLHIGCLFLSSILKNNYTTKGIIDNIDNIKTILNDDEAFNEHFQLALENLKKITQGFAGHRKESISSALRRSELDERIAKFVNKNKGQL
jgi:hypothetical protein